MSRAGGADDRHRGAAYRRVSVMLFCATPLIVSAVQSADLTGVSVTEEEAAGIITVYSAVRALNAGDSDIPLDTVMPVTGFCRCTDTVYVTEASPSRAFT